MKDEYSVDYSIPENEVSFLKGMIREYYQPEIERLNNELKSDENYYVRNLKAIIKEKDKEIERLHSIIKEVRELVEKADFGSDDNWTTKHTGEGIIGAFTMVNTLQEHILEILDKEHK